MSRVCSPVSVRFSPVSVRFSLSSPFQSFQSCFSLSSPFSVFSVFSVVRGDFRGDLKGTTDTGQNIFFFFFCFFFSFYDFRTKFCVLKYPLLPYPYIAHGVLDGAG